jgi:superoxide dismutase, Fe-Mn family
MLTLMKLPYSTDALAPVINSQTVEIHHGKHHSTYLNNLNAILAEFPDQINWDVEKILLNLNVFPETNRQSIINNAGQVYNHNLYWNSMQGGEQKFELSPELGKAIDKFESYEKFQELWKQAGLTQFGSGWVWLVTDDKGELTIEKSSNADSPLLHGKKPIMTMDVWEHAYYLDHQNKRADYIDGWFSLINWAGVSERFAEAINS